jgi:ribosomal protein L37AE/L43A
MVNKGCVMRQKVKERIQENTEEAQCHHFWNIEVANGPTSIGTCKHCGETKEFLNAFPTFNPLKKNGNPLSLPKLQDVEIDEENKS